MAKRFLWRHSPPLYITLMTLLCLLVLSSYSTVCGSVFSVADINTDLPVEEKNNLVIQGVRRYETGHIKAAREILESAKRLYPSDPAVPYYLGAICLQENRRADAISEWRQFVSISQDSEDAIKIRKYLTLLAREEAAAYARQAVADETILLRGHVADDVVAVVPFHNVGSETLSPVGKGLAAMLINDLSKVPDLQVVERIKLQALLQEMDLGSSGVISPETAPKAGKLLKSGHVLAGSLLDPEEEVLTIFSVMMNTERARSVYTRDNQCALSELFDMEKHIACSVIESLGRDCESMPADFRKIHTRSYRAFILWAKGLDALDAGRFREAREWFQQAVDEDPAFDLAKDALASAPLPEMSAITPLQMVSSLSGKLFAGLYLPPWLSIFRSQLEKNDIQPRDEDEETLEAILREALFLAFSVEKKEQAQRTGDCLNTALGIGYPPYIVLKTMFEVGDNLELDPLCKSASASGVVKAVFARAARDAVSPSDRNIYTIAQIGKCPCLRGQNGLGYTVDEENLDYSPFDSVPDPPPVSVVIP